MSFPHMSECPFCSILSNKIDKELEADRLQQHAQYSRHVRCSLIKDGLEQLADALWKILSEGERNSETPAKEIGDGEGNDG